MEVKRSSQIIWFERYDIKEQIGKGATGHVYLAEDTRLKRYVAIKVMKAVGEDFHKEVRVLQSLSLRILPTIYDAFLTEDGEGILIMEYVKGLDGMAYIRTHGPASPSQVYQWGITLAEGLKKLHESAGHILYRDLKPANVIIDEYGEIRLIDVGAALVGEWNEGVHRGQVGTLFSTRVGSAGYAAPEQWDGRRLDESADVYGLGMVLTDFLTGQLRFVAGEKQHGTRQEKIPEGMRRVLKKATAEGRGDRYANMEAFLQGWKNYGKMTFVHEVKARAISFLRIASLLFMIYYLWHFAQIGWELWKQGFLTLMVAYFALYFLGQGLEKRRGYWVCQRSLWRYDD